MADSPQDASHDDLAHLRHQLRTPLNHIIGYSELLIDEATDSGQTALLGDLHKIKDAGTLLLTMLNELLEAEKAGAGWLRFSGRPAPAEAAPPLADDADEAATIPGCLLVVDDDPANRDVLTRLLRRQGHTVVEAGDGEQALAAAWSQEFDAILLDIMMPILDGYATLRRLKTDPRLRHVPVLMISAYEELDSVVRCIQMGAEDYLAKPINATLLKARLTSTLEKKRLRDAEQRLYDQVQENFARLQQLERLRDDLTSMIVHDLRTPLTALLSGMQSLPLLGDMNAAQTEFLVIATSGGETLLGMINDLLDISKMEDGSLKMDFEEVPAAKIIADAQAQVRPLVQQQALTLTCDIPAELPLLRADEDKLRRVLVNLLSNAIKYTPADGVITLAARRSAEEIVFSVRDTGMGIPRESFDRIFQKFGQVETKEAKRRMSTGLGLTFCKMIAEQHGGRIWVESEPGQGSVFSFTVPTIA